MTDRIPGAPGQYKAVVNEENLQKMQAGEEFVITMTRDDQPLVEGTPYSKATVLPDELAQSLCPGVEDPTPADAFSALLARAEESTEYPGCYYRMVDGEQEWLNPPMISGVEYRTTERTLNSRVVYTKLIYYAEENLASYMAGMKYAQINKPLGDNAIAIRNHARTSQHVLPAFMKNSTEYQAFDMWANGSFRYEVGSDVTPTTLNVQWWYYKK